MTLYSAEFFAFFGAAWLAIYLVPDRWRVLVLLIASIGFYGALLAPNLLVVLAMVAVLTWYFGLKIEHARVENRVRFLWAGICCNVSLLALVRCVPVVAAVFQRDLTWSTIGVSYYTLQAVSYVVDVYMRVQVAEPRFTRVALYLAFFPKLLQGPVERAGDLLPQFEKSYQFNYENARAGAFLFCCGLFKKLVVADRLALLVDDAYSNVHAYGGITLILATVLYAFQIYADFSGYTDMALGVARVLNITLSENFRSPYLAVSVADFWRRWHISFSRWLLDYVFKPIQMSLRDWRKLANPLALVATFLLCGVWHGAALTFLIWGFLHGSYMALGYLSLPYRRRAFRSLGLWESPVHRVLRTGFTFCLVAFAWIFFRASNVSDALYITANLTRGVGGFMQDFFSAITHGFVHTGLKQYLPKNQMFYLQDVLLGVFALVLMSFSAFIGKRINIFRQPIVVRWFVYLMLVAGTAMLGARDSHGFIYLGF